MKTTKLTFIYHRFRRKGIYSSCQMRIICWGLIFWKNYKHSLLSYFYIRPSWIAIQTIIVEWHLKNYSFLFSHILQDYYKELQWLFKIELLNLKHGLLMLSYSSATTFKEILVNIRVLKKKLGLQKFLFKKKWFYFLKIVSQTFLNIRHKKIT